MVCYNYNRITELRHIHSVYTSMNIVLTFSLIIVHPTHVYPSTHANCLACLSTYTCTHAPHMKEPACVWLSCENILLWCVYVCWSDSFMGVT